MRLTLLNMSPNIDFCHIFGISYSKKWLFIRATVFANINVNAQYSLIASWYKHGHSKKPSPFLKVSQNFSIFSISSFSKSHSISNSSKRKGGAHYAIGYSNCTKSATYCNNKLSFEGKGTNKKSNTTKTWTNSYVKYRV